MGLSSGRRALAAQPQRQQQRRRESDGGMAAAEQSTRAITPLLLLGLAVSFDTTLNAVAATVFNPTTTTPTASASPRRRRSRRCSSLRRRRCARSSASVVDSREGGAFVDVLWSPKRTAPLPPLTVRSPPPRNSHTFAHTHSSRCPRRRAPSLPTVRSLLANANARGGQECSAALSCWRRRTRECRAQRQARQNDVDPKPDLLSDIPPPAPRAPR